MCVCEDALLQDCRTAYLISKCGTLDMNTLTPTTESKHYEFGSQVVSLWPRVSELLKKQMIRNMRNDVQVLSARVQYKFKQHLEDLNHNVIAITAKYPNGDFPEDVVEQMNKYSKVVSCTHAQIFINNKQTLILQYNKNKYL